MIMNKTGPAADTVPLDLAERAYHQFLRATKVYWSREMYSGLRREFQDRGLDRAPVDEAERAMRDSPAYRFFAWFERNLQ